MGRWWWWLWGWWALRALATNLSPSLPPAPHPLFFISFLCQFNGTGNSARLAAMLGEAGWVGEAEAPLGEAEIGGVPAACVGEAVRCEGRE